MADIMRDSSATLKSPDGMGVTSVVFPSAELEATGVAKVRLEFSSVKQNSLCVRCRTLSHLDYYSLIARRLAIIAQIRTL
jgi:hypothetical protein